MKNWAFHNEIVVSDASPIITTEHLPSGVDFLKSLFHKMIVPEKVMEEVVRKKNLSIEQYLQKRNVEGFIEVQSVTIDMSIPEIGRFQEKNGMGFKGEAHAASLAKRLGIWLLIEDRTAFNFMRRAGIQVKRFGGQIVRLHKLGHLTKSEAKQLLDELLISQVYSGKRYTSFLQDL